MRPYREEQQTSRKLKNLWCKNSYPCAVTGARHLVRRPDVRNLPRLPCVQDKFPKCADLLTDELESLLIYQGRVNSGYAAALSYVRYGRCGYFVFDAVPPRLRNLTPAPPPFSSMNSTPAACSVLCIYLDRPSGHTS